MKFLLGRDADVSDAKRKSITGSRPEDHVAASSIVGPHHSLFQQQ